MGDAMITLYTFGPAWGLPDPSPFVTKAIVLLKMSGLPFETNTKGFGKAPRGKLPYIRDGETIVADSTLIRFHLESRHTIDFDRGLTPEQRGIAWAVEKLCEDYLYWLLIHARWIEGDNFERGPARFFDIAPAPLRPFIKLMVRRQIRRNLHGQGLGRFTQAERTVLADRAFASISAIIGDKPYLVGETPCGADATVYGFVAGALCPLFETGLRTKAESYPNLRNYCGRLTQQYFPGNATA
ncbi:MAG: glutathione S-transferase family protein [Rhodomicrobium sp.]